MSMHDVEAEQCALGGMMLSKAVVWEVMEVLEPTDFHDPKHETIARTIVALASSGEPTDPVAVFNRLRDDQTGIDAPYLHHLVEVTPTAANAAYYAGIVRQRAERRRLKEAAVSINQLAAEENETPADLVERARGLVDDVSRSTKRQIRRIGESLPALYESLDQAPEFIKTPWADLNQVVGGLRAGTLTIIGARPGIGKTVVGLQIAHELAREGSVGYVSLEMSESDIQKRLHAQVAQIPMSSLMDHQMMPTHWQSVAKVRAGLEQIPLYIADDLETLTQIQSFARSLARRGNFKGLVVDYLQLMTSGKREESRQQEVSSFSRSLKLLAGDLGIPIIALSQLNRAVEGRKTGKPQLADLRESGSIEQDADVVMLLHRDEKQRPNDLEIIVAKNRHGKQGDVTLKWEGVFARAITRPWSPTALLEKDDLRG
ncbi:replicative DNA helicase [Lysinibacter cavernae]|uniref:DNA 5'-3' helicase n=1 Tax=Lysinibacter cavernae TaxID=1640652 RepID=A0A7X5QYU5_9MICO|nr:replicative DNA helicase [Lysinibacter cavernae]NIH52529.1 replicative DNA helicase [Lysinibacter cavernae]